MNELGLRIVVRLLELHRENERLRKDLHSRRRQADTWRKKYKKLIKKRAA